MIIKTNHFEFEKVNWKNLEELRLLRNTPVIQNYLVNNGEVSEEQQIAWFKKEDTINNHYFIAKQNNSVIGYCLLRHIDYEVGLAEPGTFIATEDLFDSSMAALFMISFMDICRFLFGIKKFHGNVLATNNRALTNYEWFGADKEINKDKNEITLTETESQPYEQSTNKIRKALRTLYDYEFDITIVMDKLVDNELCRNLFLSLANHLPGDIRSKVKVEIEN